MASCSALDVEVQGSTAVPHCRVAPSPRLLWSPGCAERKAGPCTLRSLSPLSGPSAHGWYGCHSLTMFIFGFFHFTWSQLSSQTHFAFSNSAWFLTPMLKWDLRGWLISALTQKRQLCLFDDKIKVVLKNGEIVDTKQGAGGSDPLLQRLLGRRPLSSHLHVMERCADHSAKP